MRELTCIEMNSVAGADLLSGLQSMVLGATAAGTAGAIIGGVNGGNGGGILGIGSIGQLVGMIGGGLIGLVSGGISGLIVGWDDPDTITSMCLSFYNSVIDGTFYVGQTSSSLL
ncbi:colicin V synthesis protein [Erwinia endophytica]|uniref:colicin V synthesis protein n=1 Tax=Erwinia endophytica TaxID=1563158 RepID=UPI001265FDA2|nr:colicin V synthesis protein [Erwinia endophytica]KAB8310740.1 colicin V synthesis protein [Erwinia endophytica]